MKALFKQVVLALLCFAHVTQAVKQDATQIEYAILFDRAGSSGTRMEIYQFLASGPSLQPSQVIQLRPSPHIDFRPFITF